MEPNRRDQAHRSHAEDVTDATKRYPKVEVWGGLMTDAPDANHYRTRAAAPKPLRAAHRLLGNLD